MGASQGQQVANALGWHYWQQSGGGIQVVSRFPIIGASSGGLGVEIQLQPGRNVWLFNAHLSAYPYQPYDLRDDWEADGDLDMDEADVIAQANAARGGQVTNYLNDMTEAIISGLPMFLTGDFNEPSHLDWTQEAADATARPFDFEVAWPASTRLADAGWVDSYRAVRPDELTDPGYTWTPGTPPPTIAHDEVHDRIDFVYHQGRGIEAVAARTLGIDSGNVNTDIAVAGYNSDHRAVAVDFTIDLDQYGAMLGDLDFDGDIDKVIDHWNARPVAAAL